MKENKLKIGDKVKIVGIGNFYTTYYDMAKKMDLKNWVENETLPYGTFATVIAMEDHCTFEGDTIIGIETSNNDQFMIGSRGLELIDKSIDEIETDKVIKISREIKELINYLQEQGHLDGEMLTNNMSIADKEWSEVISKIGGRARLRLTNEDEEIIRKIANKY